MVTLTLLGLGCGQDGPIGPGTSAIVEPPAEPSWAVAAMGVFNGCALTTDGQPHCWGHYAALPGQGGPSAVASVATPVPESGALSAITVGGGVACGIDGAGVAFCWGWEISGELGDSGARNGETRTPVAVEGATRFAAIDAGYDHVCALDLSGRAWCWGGDISGALGVGSASPMAPPRTVPAPVVGERRYIAISAGTGSTCALDEAGRAWCWGSGYGAVGVAAPDSTHCAAGAQCRFSTPQPVTTELRFAAISAGNGFTCAVATDGAGHCWGAVPHLPPMLLTGVLGTGSTAGSAVPVPVTGGLRFQRIEAGTRSACGLTTAGEIWCWGANILGELGTGRVDNAPHPTPSRVPGGLRFKSLTVGERACGLTERDNVYCWGLTAGGRLGNGETDAGVRGPERVRR